MPRSCLPIRQPDPRRAAPSVREVGGASPPDPPKPDPPQCSLPFLPALLWQDSELGPLPAPPHDYLARARCAAAALGLEAALAAALLAREGGEGHGGEQEGGEAGAALYAQGVRYGAVKDEALGCALPLFPRCLGCFGGRGGRYCPGMRSQGNGLSLVVLPGEGGRGSGPIAACGAGAAAAPASAAPVAASAPSRPSPRSDSVAQRGRSVRRGHGQRAAAHDGRGVRP